MPEQLLALPWCYRHESGVAEFLRSAAGPNPHAVRLCGPSAGVTEFAASDDGLSILPVPAMTAEEKVGEECPLLDESQKAAVVAAVKHRAVLITGGAGAGKTFILRAVANLYGDAGLRVGLCAPTGKAAKRLEEITGRKAKTIHRLLEYGRAGSVLRFNADDPAESAVRQFTGFARDSSNPLDEDVVICDESSMISADLAFALFSAVGPKTALVLVGDHHQLPPVGAGALLRDCIDNRLLPLAILSRCHRQAGPLKTNAAAVLAGRVEPTFVVPKGIPGPWYVDKKLDDADAVIGRLTMLWTGTFRDWGYDRVKDVQILTPMRKGPLGTWALNVLLQRLYQQDRGVTVEPPPKGSTRTRFHVGDRVIQTTNDYQLDVMNGSTGIVVDADDLTVDFDGREVEIPREKRGCLELAYALTAHKFQGSQAKCVAFICHRSHAFMLTRSILYTACTRPTQTMILLGDEAGLKRAAGTVVVNERRTLLPAMMAAPKVL